MRTLDFSPSPYKTYTRLKTCAPEYAVLIKSVIQDILEHPFSGKGDPVQLNDPSLWVRNLRYGDSIVYEVTESSICIVAIFISSWDLYNAINPGFAIDSYNDEDYASVMALMSANRGKANQPQVGIFWYNRARNELFGVVSHRLSDYSKANASDGRITCSEMHEDVWKKEFRKQKYHGDGTGPYIGAYQDKPRGRVFYNMASETFEVAVGKWLEDFPQAYDLVIEEFNLPRDRTKVMYAVHWDIGMSWR